jgi:hypothetical protein
MRSFPDHRSAALALLNGDAPLSRKAGSFLGLRVVDATELTDPQREWLTKLLERAGLPPLMEAHHAG